MREGRGKGWVTVECCSELRQLSVRSTRGGGRAVWVELSANRGRQHELTQQQSLTPPPAALPCARLPLHGCHLFASAALPSLTTLPLTGR